MRVRAQGQGPRNNGAEGARAPPLFCNINVSNKRSERNVKKNECEEKEDQKRNEMKGMRGRENDQNISRAP